MPHGIFHTASRLLSPSEPKASACASRRKLAGRVALSVLLILAAVTGSLVAIRRNHNQAVLNTRLKTFCAR